MQAWLGIRRDYQALPRRREPRQPRMPLIWNPDKITIK